MIEREHQRFYDPEPGPDEDGRLKVVLCHVDDQADDEWKLGRRIAYQDRHFPEPIVVPRDLTTFTTDLTSVPQLFTWLVPRTGTHLAAALVHDALTPPFSAAPQPDWIGPPTVTQMQADRVFRDAMADLGTPRLRRWMVWAAVSVPTAWRVSKLAAAGVLLSFATVLVLGWLATMDLFDQGRWLPWMGDRTWPWELLGGGLAALIIPLALAALWPKHVRSAGAIVLIAVAALVHVTIAVGGVTCMYQVAEYRLGAWGGRFAKWKLIGTLAAIAIAVFGWWWCRRW